MLPRNKSKKFKEAAASLNSDHEGHIVNTTTNNPEQEYPEE